MPLMPKLCLPFDYITNALLLVPCVLPAMRSAESGSFC